MLKVANVRKGAQTRRGFPLINKCFLRRKVRQSQGMIHDVEDLGVRFYVPKLIKVEQVNEAIAKGF